MNSVLFCITTRNFWTPLKKCVYFLDFNKEQLYKNIFLFFYKKTLLFSFILLSKLNFSPIFHP